MADQPDKDQQTEAASPKKLEQAAERGDVAIAADVRHLAMLAAALGIVVAGVGPIADGIARLATSFWGRADALVQTPDASHALLSALLGHGLLIVAAPMVIALAGTVVAGALQGRFVVAGQRVAPQWQRVNPAAGLKRLFGAAALEQFAKTLLKLALVGAAAWSTADTALAALRADSLSVAAMLQRLGSAAAALLWAVVLAVTAVAILDLAWSKISFARRMRMSREELKREARESEGDPHLKARLKALRLQRGRRRMVSAVEKATVVVMNPTHFAVALHYDHSVGRPPVVVAKGVDRLALMMRDRAMAHGVAVVQDPPLARALHAATEVGQSIPVEQFEAVARIIGFVLRAQQSYRA